MKWSDYFRRTEGLGILGTADSKGKVDLAIYTKPYVINDKTLAFVMRKRLSYENLKENCRAAYMFIERVDNFSGKRFYLAKTREEANPKLINSLKEQNPAIHPADLDDSKKYVVYFQIKDIRPLIGDRE